MNRNFLTAFCIVALVGLSCPIVAKLACPVDEYFNQELQSVTESTTRYPQLSIQTQPGFYYNYNNSGYYVTYLSLIYDYSYPDVNMTRYIHVRFQYLNLRNDGSYTAGAWYDIGTQSSYVQNITFTVSPSLSNYLFRAHIWDDFGSDFYSDSFTAVFQSQSKSLVDSPTVYINDVPYTFSDNEVIYYDEKNESSEIIDEPKRKEEDIEESETEFSEVPEITE